MVRRILSAQRQGAQRRSDATFLLRSVLRRWLLRNQGVGGQVASAGLVDATHQEVAAEREAAATTAVQETRTPSYVSTNGKRKKQRVGGTPPSIVAVHGAQSTAAVEVDTEYGGQIASPELVDATQHDEFPQDGGYEAEVDPMECIPNLLDATKAAIRIQAAGREWLKRRGVICREKAATTIQRVVRSWLVCRIQSAKREAQ